MKIIHFLIKHSPLNKFIHQKFLFRYDMDNGKVISPIPFPPQTISCLYFYPYHRINWNDVEHEILFNQSFKVWYVNNVTEMRWMFKKGTF